MLSSLKCNLFWRKKFYGLIRIMCFLWLLVVLFYKYLHLSGLWHSLSLLSLKLKKCPPWAHVLIAWSLGGQQCYFNRFWRAEEVKPIMRGVTVGKSLGMLIHPWPLWVAPWTSLVCCDMGILHFILLQSSVDQAAMPSRPQWTKVLYTLSQNESFFPYVVSVGNYSQSEAKITNTLSQNT